MRHLSFLYSYVGWLGLLLLSLSSCGEDAFLNRRDFYHEPDNHECLLVYNYDWTKMGLLPPSGMSSRLEGRHTGTQTDLTNNVSSNSFIVEADTFKLMTYNLSPGEFGSLTFYHPGSYDSIRVKVNAWLGHDNKNWEGSMVYSQEPEAIGVGLDTVSITQQNVEQGDTIVRPIVVSPLVSTLKLRIHVKGLKNMRSLEASITGLADGCYLTHPELPTDTCNMYLNNWRTSLDSNNTDGWVTTTVNCFGLPVGYKRVENRAANLNTLRLAFTLRDNTPRYFTFEVGDLFHYYEGNADETAVGYITLNLELKLDINLPNRTITLPDVTDNNSSGFNADVDPWEEGGNTDIRF